jgi:3-hydroxymyristoyl/3-hydroxydecanoyl-(acyl carrier protein) dehydratase
VTALSVEFVAKPQEAHRVQSAIAAALAGALQRVSGFAGCLVMISEQEARLVTVITLWVGEERQKQCRENSRWVQKLLIPYVDRCLRVQTLAAHSPVLPKNGLEMNFEDEYSTGQCRNTEDETACVV